MTTRITFEQDPAGVQAQAPLQHCLPENRWQANAPVSVSEPMAVLWQGVEYPVAHWDVHGFTLERAIPTALAPGRGRVIDVALLIGQGDTRIQMHVQARIEAGGVADLRYQFMDLGRAQAELLHRIVDYAVTKQELSLTQLLNDARETRAAQQVTTQRTLAFRTLFQISLACVALGGAAYMALGSLTTVKSRYAAVSAAAASVSAPAAGMVTQLTVGEGAHVAAGDVLGYLRTADHDARTEALSDRLRALEAEQAELNARKAELDRHDAHGAWIESSERERLKAAIQRAQSRLTLEREQLARLQATGLPTLDRQQARTRQQATVLGAEADLESAKAALNALETALAHGHVAGNQGVFNAGNLSQETLALRLGHLTREIALAYEREEMLAKGLPVVSPCDCEVAQVTRVTGEWVEPAQPLFVMSQASERVVHALVMAEVAGRINAGDRAQIRLADGSALNGRVTRLSYDNHRPGYAGLQSDVFAAERYARVEVMPDQPLTARIGLTGTITVRTLDPMGWLRDRIGG